MRHLFLNRSSRTLNSRNGWCSAWTFQNWCDTYDLTLVQSTWSLKVSSRVNEVMLWWSEVQNCPMRWSAPRQRKWAAPAQQSENHGGGSNGEWTNQPIKESINPRVSYASSLFLLPVRCKYTVYWTRQELNPILAYQKVLANGIALASTETLGYSKNGQKGKEKVKTSVKEIFIHAPRSLKWNPWES